MRRLALAAAGAALGIAGVPAALSSHGATRDKGPSWSPDGSLIAFNTGESPEQIWVARPDGTGHRKLSRSGAPEAQPAWSPDGRRIAFASMPSGNWDIYVMSADGGNRTRLVSHAANDTAPAWAPDGSRLAYQRADEERSSSEIRVVAADGSGDRRLTGGARNESPSWSPDGARIVFQSTRDGTKFDLYVMNADGTGVQRITATPGRREDGPSWSPDGERIVFAAGTDHMPRDVYVVDANGSNERQLTRRGQPVWSPRWSPDGRRIAFFEFPFPGATIYLMNADGSGVTTLFGRLGFAGLTVTPKRPVAGRAFSAILRVTGSGGGTVTCRASSSGTRLPLAAKTFSSGRALCTWTLPRSARGKRLTGSIAVSERGSRVARSFSFSVR